MKKMQQFIINLIPVILLLCSSILFSQSFNGNYKSFSTSYSDVNHSKNDYFENSEFNIYMSNDFIGIQDVRIPKNILLYQITQKVVQTNNLYVYNDSKKVGEDLKTSFTVTFYFKNNQLNLMVSNDQFSQVFNDLKQQSNE